MAIHAHLHGETLPAISILLDFFHRTMTIRTLNIGRKMQSVVKHHVFRQNLLVNPRKLLSPRQKGIQLFNSWVFCHG